MADVIFVGDSEFNAVFEAFGFAVFAAHTPDEFRSFLAESKSSGVRLICALSSLEIPSAEAAALLPSAGIVYLSDTPDRSRLMEHYRALSEKASGVDLTGKL